MFFALTGSASEGAPGGHEGSSAQERIHREGSRRFYFVLNKKKNLDGNDIFLFK